MLRSVVCGIEVIREGREFCGDGIDLFHEGRYVELLAESADGQFGALHTVGDLSIGETELFRLAQKGFCDQRKITVPVVL